MKSPSHILIESLDHFRQVRSIVGDDHATWYSTSPGVIETLRAEGLAPVWLDALPKPGTADRIGRMSLRVTDRIVADMEPVAEALGWPNLRIAVGIQLHRLLAVLLFKQALLDAWLAATEGKHVVVGETDLAPQTANNLGVGIYETLFAVLAARMSAAGLRALACPRAAVSHLEKEIDRPSRLTAAVSFSDLAINQVLYRMWRLAGFPAIPRTRRGAPCVLILNANNDGIREMLPHLVRRGCRIARLSPEAPDSPGDPVTGLPGALAIAGRIAEAAAAEGVDGSWRGVAEIAAERLHEASRFWSPAMRAARSRVDRLFNDDGDTVIVSSTLKGNWALALSAAAAGRGVRTVVCQHGVSAGLSRYHVAFRHLAEAVMGRDYLVCAKAAVDLFAEEGAARGVEITPIGLPEKTRTIPNRRWQRFLVRTSLRCRRQDRLVMYLAGVIENNLRMLPYVTEDHEVHALQRTMADDVMPRVRGVPVIKLYATRRYRDPDPLAEGFAAPPPVRTLKEGDFRFLRAGVDAIILESPLSTLGWAMGARKPTWYLAHPSLPLLPEARAAMERALFFFDLSRPDWPEALVASLNRPDAEIAAAWEAKAAARETFLSQFVFGPENPGRNGARAVIAAARRPLSVSSRAPDHPVAAE